VVADASAYEVILGIVIGSLLGFSSRKIMKLAERKRLIDRQSYVAQYVSLAVLSIGELHVRAGS
jgi:NhaP-type Na+/H+ or K+/H+ antiporter